MLEALLWQACNEEGDLPSSTRGDRSLILESMSLSNRMLLQAANGKSAFNFIFIMKSENGIIGAGPRKGSRTWSSKEA